MSAPVAGFFGKLPAHGDFVERGWPPGGTAAWDDWLQQALAVSREQLGERWLDVYLTSPIWRFGLSAGCLDQLHWLGVLLPSVDSVGRYFPLVLGWPLHEDCQLVSTFLGADDSFAALEQLGLAALEHGLRADDVERELQALSPPRAQPPQPGGSAAFGAGAAASALPALLEWHWRSGSGAISLWSSGGSTAVQPGLSIARGMPPTAGFAAMLDGGWRQWGWSAEQ